MTVEVDGKTIPMREHPFVKEAADFPSFVKTAFDAHREVGARIPIRVDTTKPETIEAWRKENMPKLYKAGVLAAPPEKGTAADYGIAKPDEIPNGLVWDDKKAEDYAALAHKHGLTKEAAKEFMDFHLKSMMGTQEVLKGSYDEGMAHLKKEYGDKFDTRMEQAGRLTAAILKNEAELEFFEKLGLANHPTFLSLLMRLAPLVEADSSVLIGLGSSASGGMTGEDVRKELADIMNNAENPKHKLYWGRDKATMDYVDGLYKKVYGDAKVQIGGLGVNVGSGG
jgi:hypothetical protein